MGCKATATEVFRISDIPVRGLLGVAPVWRDLSAIKSGTNLHVSILFLSVTSTSSPCVTVQPQDLLPRTTGMSHPFS